MVGSRSFSSDELKGFSKYPSPSSSYESKKSVLFTLATVLTEKNSLASLQVGRSSSFLHNLKRALERPTIEVPNTGTVNSPYVLSPKTLKNEALVDGIIRKIYPNSPVSLTPERKLLQKQPTLASDKLQKSSMLSLQGFRETLLARFGSVEEAFMKIDTNMDRSLNVREWLTILVKQQICSPEEARKIFDIMDIDRSGTVTGKEFVRVVEGAAPIQSLEDFRRRLLLAHKSTRQGFKLFGRAASGEGAGDVLLDLPKFTVLVAMPVGVTKQDEANLLFNLMDLNGDRHCTLNECTRSLLPLSPHLLIEDIRGVITARFNGSIKKALDLIFDTPPANQVDLSIDTLDIDMPGFYGKSMKSVADSEELPIYRAEFVEKLTAKVPNPQGISRQEATLFFEALDLNGEGELFKSQIESALRLAENSKSLDSLRKTVLGFFGSLKEAFARIDQTVADALEDEDDAANCTTLLLNEFEEILVPLGVGSGEISKIFRLLDVNNDGELTLTEFLNGVRLFAPWAVVNPLKASLPRVFNVDLTLAAEHLIIHLKSLPAYKDPINLDEFIVLMQSSELRHLTSRPDIVTLYFLIDAQAEGKIIGLEIKLREILKGALDSNGANAALFRGGAREFVNETTSKARQWASDLRMNTRQVPDLPTPRPWRDIVHEVKHKEEQIKRPSIKKAEILITEDSLDDLLKERQRIRLPPLSFSKK